MDRSLASLIGEFASGLPHAEVPDHVREAALWHILDTIGVCVAGSNPQEESGQAAAVLAEKWRTVSGATVFGVGIDCRPEAAALVNGALAQALEMDDKHGSSLARPGSTVTPAVLAVAQDQGLTVEDAVTAIAVGYEVMIRLGFVAGERFLERGYHTSSLLGAFGTAAAVGRLLECRAEQIVDALGIAGTFASGIQEATRTGSTSKILHGGWGAHSGIMAIELAMAGITGPASVFEGKFGFFQSHLTPIKGKLDFARAAEGLGTGWHLPDTAYKPYPCCQLLHAFIEAGKEIRAQLASDGMALDRLERISCRLAEPGLTLVTAPEESKRRPDHPHEARFSLPYTVAVTLIRGEIDLDTFRPERLTDPETLRVAGLVEWSEDPDSDYPLHCPARLEVEAGDKTYRSHVPYHPGCPEAPLSQHEVLRKFVRNTAWLLGDAADAAGAAIAATPGQSAVSSIVRRLDAREARQPVGETV